MKSDRIPPRSSVPPLEASEEHPQPETPPEPQPEPQPQPDEPQPETVEDPGEVTEENGEEEEVQTQSYAWVDIVNAPTDGSDIMVRYEGETEGRLVRWKHGRRFDGRKWIIGGRWVPVDSLQPLPAVDPTHWARPTDYGKPETAEELPAEQAV